ncbi:hypothetical protein AB0K51_32250 [Kitasatospora sp. NPDC049285]|uniref:hypothetical protein n=1 Tax=Kitasatospora sp. NPDC049285 TaxID=3157096 RepID=UPI003428F4E1
MTHQPSPTGAKICPGGQAVGAGARLADGRAFTGDMSPGPAVDGFAVGVRGRPDVLGAGVSTAVCEGSTLGSALAAADGVAAGLPGSSAGPPLGAGVSALALATGARPVGPGRSAPDSATTTPLPASSRTPPPAAASRTAFRRPAGPDRATRSPSCCTVAPPPLPINRSNGAQPSGPYRRADRPGST